MSRIKTLQDLFKRYRRPGDFTFAAGFFVLAVILLINLPSQTEWVEERTRFFAQPAFWPAVSIIAMVIFGAAHLIGALVSERIPGRLQEVLYWVRSLEYAGWFIAYVLVVPWIGYLLGTVAFTCILSWRLGYRSARWMLTAALFAVGVVVLFKGFLHVKIPAGAIYEALPAGALRTFLMSYL